MFLQKSDTLRVRKLAVSPAQERIIEHRIAGIILPVHRFLEKMLCLLGKPQIHVAQRVVVERVRGVVSGRSIILRIFSSDLFQIDLQQNLLRFFKYVVLILTVQPGCQRLRQRIRALYPAGFQKRCVTLFRFRAGLPGPAARIHFYDRQCECVQVHPCFRVLAFCLFPGTVFQSTSDSKRFACVTQPASRFCQAEVRDLRFPVF